MQILEAYQLAVDLHKGQVDKAGRPYIEHLTRVFLRVLAGGGDANQQIAALLHDSIEDGKITAQRLLDLGVPAAAVALVVTLTKPRGMGYMEYLAGVKSNSKAGLVKICDLEDNSDPCRLEALPDTDATRLREKYRKALRFMVDASSDPDSVPILGPLSLEGVPITPNTLLNFVASLRNKEDANFVMGQLQQMCDMELEPELLGKATDMALAEVAKGEELSLIFVINLWRGESDLREFAEALYRVATLPLGFLNSITVPASEGK